MSTSTQELTVAESDVVPLFDVFGNPRKAFAAMRHQSGWALGLGVTGVFNLAFMLLYFAPSLQPVKLTLTFLIGAASAAIKGVAISVALWVGVTLSGGAVRFRDLFSVVVWAGVVYAGTSVAWGAVEVLVGVSGDDARAPIYTNLAFLVPATQLALHRLAAAIDILVIYQLILFVLGTHGVSRELSLTKAAGVVSTLWVAFVLFVVGIKVIVS